MAHRVYVAIPVQEAYTIELCLPLAGIPNSASHGKQRWRC